MTTMYIASVSQKPHDSRFRIHSITKDHALDDSSELVPVGSHKSGEVSAAQYLVLAEQMLDESQNALAEQEISNK